MTGNVILTPCDIKDGGICDVDPLEVTFVLLDKSNELILDALGDTDELDLTGSCKPFEVTFVLLDKFAADEIIGNFGKGDSTVWPNAVLI